MDASIIILTYKAKEVTRECLEAIKKYTKDISYEIVIHDNSKENLGFARANNLATKRAKGKYLVFLNNDVVVTKNWLMPLINFLNKHPEVAACQPKLRSYVEKKYFDYAGGAGGFLDILGYPFTRGRIFDSVEKDKGQYDNLKEICWATGACLVVKRDAFWQVGGFDEYFFAYAEEVDLCLRLAQEGYKIYAIPSCLVYHYGAYTSNRNLTQKIYLVHRNHIYLVLKHFSLWPYFTIIIFRFFLDIASIFHYLYELKFNHILSLVRAYREIFRDLPKLFRMGVISWKGRSLLTNPTVYRGSIILDHFFLGRRSYDRKVREYKRYKDVTYFQGKRLSNSL